jgi:hypothetical protein
MRTAYALWNGSLAPERFVEFPFVEVNRPRSTRLSWPVFQTYSNGQRVDWTGPVGSDTPASVTVVSGGATWHQWLPTVLAALALVVAVIGVALALRGRAARGMA